VAGQWNTGKEESDMEDGLVFGEGGQDQKTHGLFIDQ